MKEKILKEFELGENYIDFETASNFLSEVLDSYADWKIKECADRVEQIEIFGTEDPDFIRDKCVDAILTNKDKK